MVDEFSIISRYFASFSQHIGEDCAILALGEGEQLAASVDSQVEGVHFPPDAPPEHVGYRAVVTALSDLAAVGAEPRAIALALTLPAADETWLQPFALGVGQATEAYGVELVGGDTTRGPLTITVTALGVIFGGQALTRSGAKPGDGVFVSGFIGDAAAGLAVINDEKPDQYLLQRFYRPAARIELGRQLVGVASSAIDISDGLLADAGHLCERSQVGIRLDADSLPLSPALKSLADDEQAKTWALTGGDDYELLFTVAPALQGKVPDHCARIGEVIEGSGVECNFPLDDGGGTGFKHFKGWQT